MQSIESIILVTEILSKLPYPLKVKIMKEFLSPKDECVLCKREFHNLYDYPSFKIISIKFPKSFTRVYDSNVDWTDYKFLKDESVSKVRKELKKLKINESYGRNFFDEILGAQDDSEYYDDFIYYRKWIDGYTDNHLISKLKTIVNGRFTFSASFKFDFDHKIFKESIKIVIQGIVN